MTERNPSIKLEVDPNRVMSLHEPIRFGGVRMRTVVYVVTVPDMPLFTGDPVVHVITVQPDLEVELREVE